MRKVVSASIVVFLLAATACSTQRIYSAKNRGGTIPSYEKSQHFFIYGLGQTTELDANEVCGGKKVNKTETTQTFVNGLLGVLTMGIYTPRTAKVYCE